MEVINVLISDIIIPDEFTKTTPNISKVQRIREYFNVYNTIDKPVTISSGNVLIDGYIRYLIAKENNIQSIPCVISDKNFKPKKPMKYIVGSFDNGSEYIWKIRNKLDVNVGDKVLVANKNGKAVVSVVDVFESDNKDMRKHKPVLKVIERKNNSFCKTDKYK